MKYLILILFLSSCIKTIPPNYNGDCLTNLCGDECVKKFKNDTTQMIKNVRIGADLDCVCIMKTNVSNDKEETIDTTEKQTLKCEIKIQN